MIGRPRYYRLDENRQPVPVTMLEWARGIECFWRVAFDAIGPMEVSTVFLGLDHRHSGAGPPILFETMIFDGLEDEYQVRTCTWTEAEAAHAQAVTIARTRLAAAERTLSEPKGES